MMLWRAGTVLHYSRRPDKPALCGADAFQLGPEDTASKDDLLCGLCLDVLSDNTSPDFWLVTGRGPRVDHRTYLLSARWAHLRELALEHYGPCCALCGTQHDVHVHHRTYERFGRERLSDLTVLCATCHAKHHGKAA